MTPGDVDDETDPADAVTALRRTSDTLPQRGIGAGEHKVVFPAGQRELRIPREVSLDRAKEIAGVIDDMQVDEAFVNEDGEWACGEPTTDGTPCERTVAAPGLQCHTHQSGDEDAGDDETAED